MQDEADPFYKEFVRRFEALPYEQNAQLSRIVSAHLVAEHFVDVLLMKSYPGFPFRDIRLTFEKKLKVIEPSLHRLMPSAISGLKALGKIRNRIAHDLHAGITMADVTPMVDAMREVPAALAYEFDDAPDVVEVFARHVAMLTDIACITLERFGDGGVEGFRRALAGAEESD